MEEKDNRRETASERFQRYWKANHRNNEIRNSSESLKPEISDFYVLQSKTDLGYDTFLKIAMRNLPVYGELSTPRYAFFYSYENVSADLNMQGQRAVNDLEVVVPRNGKIGKYAEFYFEFNYEWKGFFLTVIDVVDKKLVYQTLISKTTVEEIRKAKRLTYRLSCELWQKNFQSVAIVAPQLVESYKANLCELEELLRNVSDAYEDFVKGCLFLAKDFNVVRELKGFIISNPKARTDDIIEEIFTLANVEMKPLEIASTVPFC